MFPYGNMKTTNYLEGGLWFLFSDRKFCSFEMKTRKKLRPSHNQFHIFWEKFSFSELLFFSLLCSRWFFIRIYLCTYIANIIFFSSPMFTYLSFHKMETTFFLNHNRRDPGNFIGNFANSSHTSLSTNWTTTQVVT